MTNWRRIALITAAALLAAGPALAHPGHGAATFAAGLGHPFSGMDHMLAMVAVGLWAARRGGAASLAWPCAFIASMLAGYGLGLGHPGPALMQPAILATVIVLGALTAARAQAPFAVGLALIGACGLAHGYAHGSEAPATAGLGFPMGFAIATASLHLAGLAIGRLLLRLNRPHLLQALGGGVVLGGFVLAMAG
jgi:urease accessory protein